MHHTVTCAVCGKTGKIDVEKGKRAPDGWYYFGKIGDKEFWECKECVDKLEEVE